VIPTCRNGIDAHERHCETILGGKALSCAAWRALGLVHAARRITQVGPSCEWVFGELDGKKSQTRRGNFF